MIFLVHYDRKKATLVDFLTYADEQRQEAERARLDRELAQLRQPGEFEIILLEADSEQAVRHTHRRYFETLEELLRPVPEKAEASHP
jgi:hypothetical protein